MPAATSPPRSPTLTMPRRLFDQLGIFEADLFVNKCTVLLAAGLAQDALREADAAVARIERDHGSATRRAELVYSSALAAAATADFGLAQDRSAEALRLFRRQQRPWWAARAELALLLCRFGGDEDRSAAAAARGPASDRPAGHDGLRAGRRRAPAHRPDRPGGRAPGRGRPPPAYRRERPAPGPAAYPQRRLAGPGHLGRGRAALAGHAGRVRPRARPARPAPADARRHRAAHAGHGQRRPARGHGFAARGPPRRRPAVPGVERAVARHGAAGHPGPSVRRQRPGGRPGRPAQRGGPGGQRPGQPVRGARAGAGAPAARGRGPPARPAHPGHSL